MKYTDHILELKHALSPAQCAAAIEWYDSKTESQEWHSCCASKEDTYICASNHGSYWNILGNHIHAQLQHVYAQYAEHTKMFSVIDWHRHEHKMQRHVPEGGFLKWHCENTLINNVDRHTVWMYYLNTVDQGGTEFQYPSRIIQAEQGKLVLFPAYDTHLHRSQTGYTDPKYILTGWLHIHKD